ncbi:hypothetical protein H5P36_16160 [Bacillus sp. APMAM]|nr:hypothetical protein [Bacillus sp. APMAM]RTZ54907.1 hypothetical protein EKO25_15405 [Bacillus sp. SAJ1]
MKKQSMFKLILRDISYSLSYGKFKLIIFLSIIAVLTIIISVRLKTFGSDNVGIFYFLMKDNGYVLQLSDYKPPIYWFFIQFFVLFLISDYFSQDISNNRTYLLLRIHSKGKYIFSKFCWIVTQTTFIYVMIFLIIYFFSSLVTGSFSIGGSEYFNRFIASSMEILVSPGQLIFRIFLGFFLTTIVLSVMYLLFVQFIPPIVTFLGVILLSGISTISDIIWLPAIHSMIMKQAIFDGEHHLTLMFSIIYSVVLFIFLAIITFIVFRKKDML